MKIQKILFSTRFKELDENSLRSLFILKKSGLKHIILLFVIPIDDVGFVPYGGFLKDEEQKLRKMAEAILNKWKEIIIKNGIDCEVLIKIGDLVQKTIVVAEDERVDMIAVGRRKRSLIGKFNFVSPNLVDLVRYSSKPVLVSKFISKYEYKGELITRLNNCMFRNPLIATDWSKPARKSLEILINNKVVIDKVYISHVIEDKMIKGRPNEEITRIKNESIKRLNEYSDILKKDNIASETILLFGNSSREIINVSREKNVSMIMIGTTGKDLLDEVLLGSVSYRIMETSELPVLMIS